MTLKTNEDPCSTNIREVTQSTSAITSIRKHICENCLESKNNPLPNQWKGSRQPPLSEQVAK